MTESCVLDTSVSTLNNDGEDIGLLAGVNRPPYGSSLALRSNRDGSAKSPECVKDEKKAKLFITFTSAGEQGGVDDRALYGAALLLTRSPFAFPVLLSLRAVFPNFTVSFVL